MRLMLQPAVARKRCRLMLPCPSARGTNCHRIAPPAHQDAGPVTAELTLSGELDLANSGHLAADVEALCRRRQGRIRIDLGAVTFIDAAAVRAFVQARHRAGALGCELVLSNVHGLPLRVLRLVELDTVLLEEGSDGH